MSLGSHQNSSTQDIPHDCPMWVAPLKYNITTNEYSGLLRFSIIEI